MAETILYINGVNVHKIRTGDILVRRSSRVGLIYLHYGIADVHENGTISVYHNSPSRGRVAFESLDEWLEGKEILRVDGNVGLNSDELSRKIDSIKERNYNWIFWNCEHLVNFVKDDKTIVSKQVRNTAIGIGSFLLLWRLLTPTSTN